MKFVFTNGNLPKEFGVNVQSSVYYHKGNKVITNSDNHLIGNYSKINLFVGANNSGKSRFLRGLLKTGNDVQELASSNKTIEELFDDIKNWAKENIGKIRTQNQGLGTRTESLCTSVLALKDGYKKIVSNKKDYLTKLRDFLNESEENESQILKLDKPEIPNSRKSTIPILLLRRELFSLIEKVSLEIKFIADNQPSKRIYIPILRSVKRHNSFKDDLFENAVKDLYDLNLYEVYTGLSLYNTVLKIRNSKKKQRKGFEEFELFLQQNFFQNQSVEIISDLSDENHHLLLYINEEETNIHDVGDGIQQLILLLFPIFTSQKNSWFFIEEPENSLHPGLQKLFTRTLLENEFLRDKNLRFFFSTHSNHFLDLSIDHSEISIFQFEKEQKDHFNIKANVTPNKDVLDILGVNTSSVFLANSTIWVEGPTDRKYLSKFLRLYCSKNEKNQLKEDIDYAFFEYGGNLIAHYLFDEMQEYEDNDEVIREKIRTFALSNKIYLLADYDNAKGSSAKGKRRKALRKLAVENKNFHFQSTEVREIENLLPPKTISTFLQELIKSDALSNFENIDFTKSDYNKIGIGTFCKNLLDKIGISTKNQKAFHAQSGTFKNDYKIKLCEFFINSEISYDELIENNPTLEKIIENLYQFIKPVNQ